MRTVQELMSLSGRTAVVTGGAGHIGSSIAEALAEAGANIALVDIRAESLNEVASQLRLKTSQRIETFALDLSDEQAVVALPAAVNDKFGRLDILVNCAAFVGTTKLEGWAVPFEQQKTAAWRAAFEVNVTAAFELVQSALPFLKNSGNGSVINVSSIYGLLAPDWSLYDGTTMGNPAAYGASKAALMQLTNWLSTTLAPTIRVNSITPGGVWRNQPQQFVDRYETRTPMGRMAVEEDFKGAALYLASDLSAYVTGQNLIVDGGWSVR